MRVLAIVGPTASGKTVLGLRAAVLLDAEIVSADSRLVYRGMDIGTAKPTPAQRRAVPHHVIDVADPGERYDAARYQRDARAAIADVERRGRVPVVVGGTGLYVRALLDGLTLDALPTDPPLRAKLEARAREHGGAALHRELASRDPAAAARVHPRNARRVVRYLEIALLTGNASGQRKREGGIETVRIGLCPPRPLVRAAIDTRVRGMVDAGVVDETAMLLARGLDPRLPSMSAHGYIHWAAHLRGEMDLGEAIAATARDTAAYARRQMTWFRRDAGVRWLDPTTADPLDVIREALAA
ncbi:MAG: tRNA (adenosine(37)-N6)-dimethylallyltransferase MiaA [Chloroflexota bacterium]|nr:tRNA (adenosine(37)-N6)-dimethylallyltransferase MiaA [Chloroflexota bacterium]